MAPELNPQELRAYAAPGATVRTMPRRSFRFLSALALFLVVASAGGGSSAGAAACPTPLTSDTWTTDRTIGCAGVIPAGESVVISPGVAVALTGSLDVRGSLTVTAGSSLTGIGTVTVTGGSFAADNASLGLKSITSDAAASVSLNASTLNAVDVISKGATTVADSSVQGGKVTSTTGTLTLDGNSLTGTAVSSTATISLDENYLGSGTTTTLTGATVTKIQDTTSATDAGLLNVRGQVKFTGDSDLSGFRRLDGTAPSMGSTDRFWVPAGVQVVLPEALDVVLKDYRFAVEGRLAATGGTWATSRTATTYSSSIADVSGTGVLALNDVVLKRTAGATGTTPAVVLSGTGTLAAAGGSIQDHILSVSGGGSIVVDGASLTGVTIPSQGSTPVAARVSITNTALSGSNITGTVQDALVASSEPGVAALPPFRLTGSTVTNTSVFARTSAPAVSGNYFTGTGALTFTNAKLGLLNNNTFDPSAPLSRRTLTLRGSVTLEADTGLGGFAAFDVGPLTGVMASGDRLWVPAGTEYTLPTGLDIALTNSRFLVEGRLNASGGTWTTSRTTSLYNTSVADVAGTGVLALTDVSVGRATGSTFAPAVWLSGTATFAVNGGAVQGQNLVASAGGSIVIDDATLTSTTIPSQGSSPIAARVVITNSTLTGSDVVAVVQDAAPVSAVADVSALPPFRLASSTLVNTNVSARTTSPQVSGNYFAGTGSLTFSNAKLGQFNTNTFDQNSPVARRTLKLRGTTTLEATAEFTGLAVLETGALSGSTNSTDRLWVPAGTEYSLPEGLGVILTNSRLLVEGRLNATGGTWTTSRDSVTLNTSVADVAGGGVLALTDVAVVRATGSAYTPSVWVSGTATIAVNGGAVTDNNVTINNGGSVVIEDAALLRVTAEAKTVLVNSAPVAQAGRVSVTNSTLTSSRIATPLAQTQVPSAVPGVSALPPFQLTGSTLTNTPLSVETKQPYVTGNYFTGTGAVTFTGARLGGFHDNTFDPDSPRERRTLAIRSGATLDSGFSMLGMVELNGSSGSSSMSDRVIVPAGVEHTLPVGLDIMMNNTGFEVQGRLNLEGGTWTNKASGSNYRAGAELSGSGVLALADVDVVRGTSTSTAGISALAAATLLVNGGSIQDHTMTVNNGGSLVLDGVAVTGGKFEALRKNVCCTSYVPQVGRIVIAGSTLTGSRIEAPLLEGVVGSAVSSVTTMPQFRVTNSTLTSTPLSVETPWPEVANNYFDGAGTIRFTDAHMGEFHDNTFDSAAPIERRTLQLGEVTYLDAGFSMAGMNVLEIPGGSLYMSDRAIVPAGVEHTLPTGLAIRMTSSGFEVRGRLNLEGGTWTNKSFGTGYRAGAELTGSGVLALTNVDVVRANTDSAAVISAVATATLLVTGGSIQDHILTTSNGGSLVLDGVAVTGGKLEALRKNVCCTSYVPQVGRIVIGDSTLTGSRIVAPLLADSAGSAAPGIAALPAFRVTNSTLSSTPLSIETPWPEVTNNHFDGTGSIRFTDTHLGEFHDNTFDSAAPIEQRTLQLNGKTYLDAGFSMVGMSVLSGTGSGLYMNDRAVVPSGVEHTLPAGLDIMMSNTGFEVLGRLNLEGGTWTNKSFGTGYRAGADLTGAGVLSLTDIDVVRANTDSAAGISAVATATLLVNGGSIQDHILTTSNGGSLVLDGVAVTGGKVEAIRRNQCCTAYVPQLGRIVVNNSTLAGVRIDAPLLQGLVGSSVTEVAALPPFRVTGSTLTNTPLIVETPWPEVANNHFDGTGTIRFTAARMGGFHDNTFDQAAPVERRTLQLRGATWLEATFSMAGMAALDGGGDGNSTPNIVVPAGVEHTLPVGLDITMYNTLFLVQGRLNLEVGTWTNRSSGAGYRTGADLTGAGVLSLTDIDVVRAATDSSGAIKLTNTSSLLVTGGSITDHPITVVAAGPQSAGVNLNVSGTSLTRTPIALSGVSTMRMDHATLALSPIGLTDTSSGQIATSDVSQGSLMPVGQASLTVSASHLDRAPITVRDYGFAGVDSTTMATSGIVAYDQAKVLLGADTEMQIPAGQIGVQLYSQAELRAEGDPGHPVVLTGVCDSTVRLPLLADPTCTSVTDEGKRPAVAIAGSAPLSSSTNFTRTFVTNAVIALAKTGIHVPNAKITAPLVDALHSLNNAVHTTDFIYTDHSVDYAATWNSILGVSAYSSYMPVIQSYFGPYGQEWSVNWAQAGTGMAISKFISGWGKSSPSAATAPTASLGGITSPIPGTGSMGDQLATRAKNWAFTWTGVRENIKDFVASPDTGVPPPGRNRLNYNLEMVTIPTVPFPVPVSAMYLTTPALPLASSDTPVFSRGSDIVAAMGASPAQHKSADETEATTLGLGTLTFPITYLRELFGDTAVEPVPASAPVFGDIVTTPGRTTASVSSTLPAIPSAPTFEVRRVSDGAAISVPIATWSGGTFSSAVIGLTPNTTYQVRALAWNLYTGESGATGWQQFTTAP